MVELAIAVVLLVGAGLLGTSLYALLHVNLGFQPDHLAMLEVALPPSTYGKDAQVIPLGRQIISRIGGLPSVKSVAITTRQLPVSFNGNTDWIRFVGRPYNGQHNEVNERDVSAGYFTTLQARLLRGRYFTDAEGESKPKVAIINQALARKYFGGEDPIGQRIGDTDLSPKSLKEIVGVVDDVREGSSTPTSGRPNICLSTRAPTLTSAFLSGQLRHRSRCSRRTKPSYIKLILISA
jgi:hypothetical protein